MAFNWGRSGVSGGTDWQPANPALKSAREDADAFLAEQRRRQRHNVRLTAFQQERVRGEARDIGDRLAAATPLPSLPLPNPAPGAGNNAEPARRNPLQGVLDRYDRMADLARQAAPEAESHRPMPTAAGSPAPPKPASRAESPSLIPAPTAPALPSLLGGATTSGPLPKGGAWDESAQRRSYREQMRRDPVVGRDDVPPGMAGGGKAKRGGSYAGGGRVLDAVDQGAGVWDARHGGEVPPGPPGVDTVPAQMARGRTHLDSDGPAPEYVVPGDVMAKLPGLGQFLETLRQALHDPAAVEQRRRVDGEGGRGLADGTPGVGVLRNALQTWPYGRFLPYSAGTELFNSATVARAGPLSSRAADMALKRDASPTKLGNIARRIGRLGQTPITRAAGASAAKQLGLRAATGLVGGVLGNEIGYALGGEEGAETGRWVGGATGAIAGPRALSVLRNPYAAGVAAIGATALASHNAHKRLDARQDKEMQRLLEPTMAPKDVANAETMSAKDVVNAAMMAGPDAAPVLDVMRLPAQAGANSGTASAPANPAPATSAPLPPAAPMIRMEGFDSPTRGDADSPDDLGRDRGDEFRANVARLPAGLSQVAGQYAWRPQTAADRREFGEVILGDTPARASPGGRALVKDRAPADPAEADRAARERLRGQQMAADLSVLQAWDRMSSGQQGGGDIPAGWRGPEPAAVRAASARFDRAAQPPAPPSLEERRLAFDQDRFALGEIAKAQEAARGREFEAALKAVDADAAYTASQRTRIADRDKRLMEQIEKWALPDSALPGQTKPEGLGLAQRQWAGLQGGWLLRRFPGLQPSTVLGLIGPIAASVPSSESALSDAMRAYGLDPAKPHDVRRAQESVEVQNRAAQIRADAEAAAEQQVAALIASLSGAAPAADAAGD